MVVTQCRARDVASLRALVALDESQMQRVGLLTYELAGGACEVVTIDALWPRSGIGTALLNRASELARDAGATRVWLITTNDNLNAINFYERRGFRLIAVHRGAVDQARLLKASIPLVAENGIELHDELELELVLVPDVEDPISSGTPRARVPPSVT